MNINDDGSIETTSGLVLRAEIERPAVIIPPMNVVRSNSIAEIGHDGKQLFVRFKHGHLYRYPRVPVEKYAALKKSESVGKHLQVEILRYYDGYVVQEQE